MLVQRVQKARVAQVAVVIANNSKKERVKLRHKTKMKSLKDKKNKLKMARIAMKMSLMKMTF